MSTRTARAEPDLPIGVLLANLGTPAAPTTSAVRAYLREFLSDPLVVDAPRWLWWPLLYGVILPLRAPRSAHAYRSVWMDDGSPLLVYARRLAILLGERLGERYRVELGMRYGAPSLKEGLERLRAQGVARIVVAPLFPQACEATTGTLAARVAEIAARAKLLPPIESLASYPTDAGYVEALAARVREARGTSVIDHYVFSFHGIPARRAFGGDPYLEHCRATSEALAAALELSRDAWSLVFQSRFGREPWLEPYADQFVPALAARAPRVLITLPGFAADCLETIEEIGIRLRADFMAAGGREFVLVPALNDHPAWVEALAALIVRNETDRAAR